MKKVLLVLILFLSCYFIYQKTSDNKLYYLSQEMKITDAVGGAVDAANLFHRDLCREVMKSEKLSEKSCKLS